MSIKMIITGKEEKAYSLSDGWLLRASLMVSLQIVLMSGELQQPHSCGNNYTKPTARNIGLQKER